MTLNRHSSKTLLFKGSWGLTLPKIPRKEGMEKLLKGRGDPKKGAFCRKGGDAVSLGIFSSWGVANVITVTFYYILVIVFLFPLNAGVSPCFHCTVLVRANFNMREVASSANSYSNLHYDIYQDTFSKTHSFYG